MQKFIHSDNKNLEAILTYPKEIVPMMAKPLGRFYVLANKNFIQAFKAGDHSIWATHGKTLIA